MVEVVQVVEVRATEAGFAVAPAAGFAVCLRPTAANLLVVSLVLHKRQ